MKLVVQPEAEADIVNAALWYDSRSKPVRQKFLQAVESTLSGIVQHPNQYQKIYREVRRVMLRDFPYGLLYVVSDEDVNVIACFHSSRNPKRWRRRLR